MPSSNLNVCPEDIIKEFKSFLLLPPEIISQGTTLVSGKALNKPLPSPSCGVSSFYTWGCILIASNPQGSREGQQHQALKLTGNKGSLSNQPQIPGFSISPFITTKDLKEDLLASSSRWWTRSTCTHLLLPKHQHCNCWTTIKRRILEFTKKRCLGSKDKEASVRQ